MNTFKLAPLAALLLLAACSSDPADNKAAPVAKPALTVTTIVAQQASLPQRLAANGDVVAWQEAVIGSQSSGLRLTEVRVNVGDRVEAGQVLAVFDAASVEAEVAQVRAALMEAEANAADAAGNAGRARSLQTSGALSAQQINQYLTAEQTALARVASAKANLAATQIRLNYTRLTAPDSGVISARNATVGAVVGNGVEMFRLIRQGRLEWRAEVTATELGSIRRGGTALVTAANGAQVKGTVRMVAPTVDPASRTALVYVDLPRAADATAPIKAGMFAKGEFEMGVSNGLTVPQQAVVVRDGFSYVFVLNADSRVAQKRVAIGRRQGDRVEVLDGIAPNVQLVTSGAGFLNDGDLVKNVPATPAAAPKTAAAPAASAAK